MQSQVIAQQTDSTTREAARLHYVDWLRVIATLGVFLFHATFVFNELDFHIKNAEQSTAITVFDVFLFTWGMPLFFLIAGAGSWFALLRRTPGQYARERFNRLLIPFVVGSLLLLPILRYFAWSHKVQTGVVQDSFLEFMKSLAWGPTPRFFGVAGDHLWFLGFLFCYSLLTLPLFRWLKGKSGQAFVSRMARLGEHRGGVLLFILPLLVVRLSLHPFFPHYGNWADFFFMLSFFILGYLLFADKRLTLAVRRDWPITLTVGIVAFLAGAAISLSTGELDIEAAPRTLFDFIWWGLVTVCSWCWTAFVLFVGMRFLDFNNKWLRYGQEAILPFFVFHQPVIIVIAYFVVQWNAGIPVKLLAVVLGSFAVTIGLYELVVRRIDPLRAMFGMKAAITPPASQLQEAASASRPGSVTSA
jgi:peptidoglycan/LPS O-acetylase OafA/YrhL